jgi:hypothetical protein
MSTSRLWQRPAARRSTHHTQQPLQRSLASCATSATSGASPATSIRRPRQPGSYQNGSAGASPCFRGRVPTSRSLRCRGTRGPRQARLPASRPPGRADSEPVERRGTAGRRRGSSPPRPITISGRTGGGTGKCETGRSPSNPSGSWTGTAASTHLHIALPGSCVVQGQGTHDALHPGRRKGARCR